jgi:glutamate formiminotransferase/formiminotetrahydrofolate cyclodeaminase
MKMPRLSDDEKARRHQAVQEAFKQAAEVPLATLSECGKLVNLIDAVATRGNQASLSDAGMASLMCMACAEGAAMNVLINLSSIEDVSWRRTMRERVATDLEVVIAGLTPILARVKSTLLARSSQ